MVSSRAGEGDVYGTESKEEEERVSCMVEGSLRRYDCAGVHRLLAKIKAGRLRMAGLVGDV